MYLRRRALAFVLVLSVGVLLSCVGTRNTALNNPSGQVLYILSNGSVSTYTVDPGTLQVNPIEQAVDLIPPPASLVQFDPSPDDHFVYAVWSDGQNIQHLSVFQTDSSGVPQVPAVQVIDADSLSQFNMHPSGEFAYMLQVSNSNGLYYANIRLFAVHASGGTLKENAHIQGNYGPSPFIPAFLYGFSPDGANLYDTSLVSTGAVYRQRLINKVNGTLGADNQLISLNGDVYVSIGSVIAVQHQMGLNSPAGYIDVFPNVPNPKMTIHCTAAMLNACATATDVQLDPTGHFLILTDPVTSAIHVARVNLSKRRIVDTGSWMAMTAQTPGYAFNRDGNIVYSKERDGSVHFFHFDPTSGVLSEGGTPLPVPPGTGICPAEYR